MFIIHFAVVMAAVARIARRVPARMAFGAIPVGALVINGETVIERSATPRTRVVTVGALALEVIGRPCMAGLAVG